ncbi:MAG: histidinol dehydrogenase [Syntrophaceae bacterium]
MEQISTRTPGWEKRLDMVLSRSRSVSADIDRTVSEIITRVRTQGDRAMAALTRKLDRFDPDKEGFCIDPDMMAHAAGRIEPELYEALAVAAERIRAFHSHQREESWTITDATGSILGQKVTPVNRAGIYTPGGRNAFPSTLLMNVIPAQIAGVDEIVVVSPTPDGRVNDTLLAAAHILGIGRIFRIGGAQAVAALAFGTESIPKVDVVVGPGNIYVARAKAQLQGMIGIDAIAGPSEIVVIADKGASPSWIACDLLSQAEHDPMASAMLITPEETLAAAVLDHLEREQASLPRREITARSLADHGAIIITRDLDEAIAIANTIAPEHLELMLADAMTHLNKIRNAGAVFLGYHCMEAIGDYVAGPNHTLPTAATARFSSALGVYNFLKRTSIVGMSPQAVHELGPMAARMARSEDLEAHARSVDCRLT